MRWFIIRQRVFWLLWRLHIASITPAMARLMAFGIIVFQNELMSRYNYKFKHTAIEAFMYAVKKRKENDFYNKKD